jgi:hypothetical protein
VESNHLEGEGLHPIVHWIHEGDGQVDLLKRYGFLPWHYAMKRCSSQSNARLVDAHGIKHLGVHDVEAAASIHQYLGELFHADDLWMV